MYIDLNIHGDQADDACKQVNEPPLALSNQSFPHLLFLNLLSGTKVLKETQIDLYGVV